jgi:hypothetical protein
MQPSDARASIRWVALNQLPKIIGSVKFADGREVIAKPDAAQTQTAAA